MFEQTKNFRLERILSVVFFIGLIGVFIFNILGIAETAERMMIQNHVRQLKSSLNLKFAELMMTGKQNTAVDLEKTNPLLLFNKNFPEQNFEGYIGEQVNLKFKDLDKGDWAFDRSQGVLVYKLKESDLVTNLDPLPSRLQWHIVVSVIEENDPFGEGKRKRVESLHLESIFKFEWNY